MGQMTREEANAKLLLLGAWAFGEHRDWMGDIDGGSLQDKMEELGLLVRVPVTEENVMTLHEHCEDVSVDDDCLHAADGVDAALTALRPIADATRRGAQGGVTR